MDIKKRRDRSNDVFDHNLIKLQDSQSEKTEKKPFFINQITDKKEKKTENGTNKQTKNKFFIGLKNQY